MNQFLDKAGTVVSKTAEVGLPLAGLAAQGGSGMAMGNTLASFVPGTIQSDQRQAQQQDFYAQRAQRGAEMALTTSRAMLWDQIQEARTQGGMALNDQFDNALLDSQDGQQAVAYEALIGLFLRGDDQSLRAAKHLARGLGADLDAEKGTFKYRGQTYDVNEENLATLRDHALRNTVQGFLLDGVHQAAKHDFGAALESQAANAFEARGLSKSESFAATRDLIGGLPRQQVDLWRIATAYGQMAEDEKTQNFAALDEKAQRGLAEIDAQPGLDIVGNPEGQPLSAIQFHVEPGSAAAQMIGKSGIIFASEWADRVQQTINLQARIGQYYDSVVKPKATREKNEAFYWQEATDGSGREYGVDFAEYLDKNPGMPGIVKDDITGYKLNDAFFAEYQRWRNQPPPTRKADPSPTQKTSVEVEGRKWYGKDSSREFYERRAKQGGKKTTPREHLQGTRN